jgi:hypothetical protein
MNIMAKDILVRKSSISGKGVFANRDFCAREIVLVWNPKPIKKVDIQNLNKESAHFIEKIGKRFYVMQPPEKYVNHSCDPNTRADGRSDVALRNIKKGEEITSDYSGSGIISFQCHYGSKKCKKIIH